MSYLCRRVHGIFSTNTYLLSSSRTYLISSRTYLISSRTCLSSTLDLVQTQPQPRTKPEQNLGYSVREMFEEGDLKKRVEKFKQCSEFDRFRDRHFFYYETVRRLIAVKQFSLIEEVMEEQKKYPSIAEEGFAVRIIRLYGKSGMFDNARKLFDELPQLNCVRTVKSFNALLTACIDSKKFDKVEEVFREVPAKLSINPSVGSYNSLVKAYCEMGSLDSALSAVDEMERNGLNPDSITYSVLLDWFYQNERFSDGDNIWGALESKGIVLCVWCYNARLRGLVSRKRMLEADRLFRDLWSKGLRPDTFTFNALIKGFCDDKNFGDAKKWYKELANYKTLPNCLTFEMLLPLACEMADFEFALELCMDAIRRWRVLDEATLQCVVNGLVKESKVKEARRLLIFIRRTNGFYSLNVKLPLGKKCKK